MHTEWDIEIKRLDAVKKVIGEELLLKLGKAGNYKKDMRTINKEMWEDVGVINGGDLDLATDFMQEINFLKRNLLDAEKNSKEIIKLERQLQSPYFSRIDFREDDCKSESFYIGIYGLRKEDTGEFLVYDWRAPVSSMFYDYEPGEAQYECPNGFIKGYLLFKRQYRIEKSELILMFDSAIAIEDQILQDILAGSADNRMKTIVSTIQKEQNRAIRSEGKRVLAVQGPAGSGKTSIALHRAAYLLYRHRQNISAENICLYTPNGIFAKYISSILPELGEDDIPCKTLTGFAQGILKEKFDKYEHYADMMEWLLNRSNSMEYYKRVDEIRFKSSKIFAEIMESFLDDLENNIINFDDIKFEDIVFALKEELYELFRSTFKNMPIAKRLSRMELIVRDRIAEFVKHRLQKRAEELAASGEYVNAGEIKEKSRLFVKGELEEAENSIKNMLSINIKYLYSRFSEYVNEKAGIQSEKAFSENTCTEIVCSENAFSQNVYSAIVNDKQRVLYYEDQAPILYLMSLLGMIDPDNSVKHVIVDEAQDYSEVAYMLLSRLYPTCGITLLGDICQNINPLTGIGGLQKAGEILDPNSIEYLELDKSYRSTVEIMDFASKIIPPNGKPFGRHGKIPEILKSDTTEGVYDLVNECIRAARDENMNSIAVICRTMADCRQAYSHLKGVDINLVQNGDEEIPSGIVVIPSYLAKGLEFDAVVAVVLSGKDYTMEEEQLLYTVCTRALHRLNICTFSQSGILRKIEL